VNKLPFQTRVQVLSMLCEGLSTRAISRITGASTTTVFKLLMDAGLACACFHDENVRGVKAAKIRCDEIWSFCYTKARNTKTANATRGGAGDVWTWTAVDCDCKLIVSYLIGGRDTEYASAFMADLRTRLTNRVQLTTDGHKAYLQASEEAFGLDIEYGMLAKMYGEGPTTEARYNPAASKGAIRGNLDKRQVSTSHVGRANFSLRMHDRFARPRNAHSRKFENHCHLIALYTVWYNYARIDPDVKMAPAMAAGISSRLWEMADIIDLIGTAAGPTRPPSVANGIKSLI
jgi:IS1 family transposase